MTDRAASRDYETGKTAAFLDVLRRHAPLDKVSVEPFIRLITRHAHAEMEGDFEEIMATVCDQPRYSFEPMGWVIQDPKTLYDFYVEALPILKNIRPIKVWSPILYIGDDSVAVWDSSLEYCDAAGCITRVYQMATITFDRSTRLLVGENIFMNAEMAAIFDAGISDGLKSRLRLK